MLGRKMKEYPGLNFSDGPIDCSLLSPGMYWLEIMQSDGARSRYKFIKQ